MTLTATIKTQFENVLRKGGLADRSIFDRRQFFAELPLYSRYAQVEFLKDYGDPNTLLIELALDYLADLAHQHRGKTEWFAAVTILDDSDSDLFVPNILVCNGDLWPLRGLHLKRVATIFAAQVRSILTSCCGSHFQVMQDKETVPDMVRLFLSYRAPPGKMVPMSRFVPQSCATKKCTKKWQYLRKTRKVLV